MATPLQDPRKRWLSPTSKNWGNSFYNQYYPPPQGQGGSGPSSPYQNTSPLWNDDGTRYRPTGKPDQWEATDTPDIDPSNFLADWDYQNPPIGLDGRPLNYNNEALPQGASGWTPFGEPDFTPVGRNDLAAQFEGWFKGIQYRLHKGLGTTQEKNPFVEASEKSATAFEQGDFLGGLKGGWDALMQLGPGLRELGGTEEGDPSALTYAGRTLSELGRGVGSAFSLFGKTAESLIGTGQLTQKQLSEGSPLPEIRYPDWVPGWAEVLSNSFSPVSAYNSLRQLASPNNNWDNMQDKLAENWQASRIAYSVIDEPALKDEFIRRYKAGENPAYLAMELENPIDELLGQLVIDPLNVAGFFTRAGTQTRRLAKVEDIFVNPAGDIGKVFDNLRAGTVAEGANGLTNLAQTVQNEAGKIANNLDNLAQNRGLLQLTTEGKRTDLANRSGEMLRFIFSSNRKANNAYDFDRAMEMLRGLVLATDPQDLSAVSEGVNVLTHSNVPRPLFSRAGLELGTVLRNTLVDEAGTLKFDDLLRGFEEAQKGGIEEVTRWATGKLDNATKTSFPTVLEQAADPAKYPKLGRITPAQEFVARFDKATKSKIYTPINRFFANVYMGMSPGFAFRNLMNNALTLSVDTGPTTLFVPKDKAIAGIRNLLGGALNSKATQGVGMAAGAAGVEVGKGEKWWQKANGLALSQRFEETASAQISYKAVKDAMRRMLQPGRALPDITPLVNAGLPLESANLLSRLVLEFNGDVNKAIGQFRKLAASGNVEVAKTIAWMSGEDIRIADKFNKLEEIQTILRGEGTLAEKQAAITKLGDDLEGFAEAAKFETPGATDNLGAAEGQQTLLGAAEATSQGLMSDAENAIVNHRVWANAYARRAYESLVTTISREASAFAAQSGDTQGSQGILKLADDVLRQMDELWSGANFKHETFTKDVWARTQELKSGKSTASVPQLWDEFQMAGEPGQGMTQAEFLEQLWNHWRTETRTRFATAREAYAAFGESYWQKLRETNGYEPSQALLDKARNALRQAQAYDDAVVETTSKGPLVFQKKDMILSALGQDKTGDAIRILADHYGIPTATAKGAPMDNQLLTILKKYGSENATLTNTSIDDAWRTFEAQRAGKGKTALIENLDEYLGRVKATPPPPAQAENVFQAGKTAAQNVAATPENFVIRAREPIQIGNDVRVAASGKTGKVIRPAESITPTNRVRGYYVLLENGEQKWFSSRDLERIEWFGDKPTPLSTPYMDGTTPTGPRATAENLAGLKDWLGRLNGQLAQNWGRLVPADFTPEVEKALSGWQAQATERIGEARLMASGYADIVRDFALHDYGKKRNLDLLSAYLLPYEFWYSRTYKNWLWRLVNNPETVAAYAKYKTALEHQHAGAPDWWKYNINTNELLGRDDDNPLFFNLEATLNPLNGITGVDFNDPAKRVDWLTRSLDDMGKFGPTLWTPLAMALAVSLYAKGEEEAAARWAGRLVPQTATLRSIGALGNLNIEADPFVHFFSGGQDPYEKRRTAMALGALAQGAYVNGEYVQITDEQAVDAANPTIRASNPEAQEIWDLATQYALDKRAGGQLASFFLGVGFKGRNVSDIQIDQMYNRYYSLWNNAPNLNSEEFRTAMEELHVQYPWMDAILLAKKSGPEVDRALAYNVLGRLPPGQSSEITELIGIDPGIIEQFYQNKGDLSFMTKPDRDRFMAGVVDLAALLALPESATRYEWAQVRNEYKAMQDAAKLQFGEDIWERVDRYFALNLANPEAAKLLMGTDPLIEAALNYKEQAVMENELLFTYYGGLDFLEKYYNGEKYDSLNQQFPNIQSTWDGYYALKDAGDDKGARDYFKAHPELSQYLETRDTWDTTIDNKLAALDGKLREPLPAELRDEFVEPAGVYQEQAAPTFGYQPYTPTWDDYQSVLSESQARLLEDYFSGARLSNSMHTSLESMAEQMGVTVEQLLEQMQTAYYGAQVPVTQ